MIKSRITRHTPPESELETILKAELSTSMLRPQEQSGGGRISEGSTYDIDSGKVFIKVNRNKEVPMFTHVSILLLVFLFNLSKEFSQESLVKDQ